MKIFINFIRRRNIFDKFVKGPRSTNLIVKLDENVGKQYRITYEFSI